MHLQVINSATVFAPGENSLKHNPNSAFSTTVKKPALGPSFTFLTDATLWLSAIRAERATMDELEDWSTTHVAEIFRSKTTVGTLCV